VFFSSPYLTAAKEIPVCDLSFIVVLLVGLTGLVFGWRALARRHALPCPPEFIWLLENRAMDRVAGSALLLDRAGIVPGMDVLDAGCGPGRLTIPLAERVGERGSVLAVDLQEEMLSRLKVRLEARRITNVHTLKAALGNGALPADAFDRALLVTVLGEIPDRVKALGEIRRSLKPGGVLSVTEVFPDPHFQTRNTVRKLAEQAGLELRELHGNWRAFTINLAHPAKAPVAGSSD
jgi:ubiquinone/menaquinone biosynthesis C-methylase UbiE